jgi:hypothetical protein
MYDFLLPIVAINEPIVQQGHSQQKINLDAGQ